MSIKQINFSFDPLQDRVLMRISTHGGLEYRAWLTRRIVRALLPSVREALAEVDDAVTDPATREAVSRFQHESAIDRACFSADYDDTSLQPAHDGEPLLVTRVQMQHAGDDQYRLLLTPARGQALQMRLGSVLVHAMLELLHDAAERAQWDITRPETAPPATTGVLN